MSTVRLFFLGMMLSGCGALLSSGDDGVALPDRPDAEVEAESPADATADTSIDATTTTCGRHPACSGTEVGGSGMLLPSPDRLCLETCLRVVYDPNGFGDAAADLVKIADVVLSDGAGRVGSFNLGLARIPYLFADGEPGDFNVLQWPPEKMPRERWLHVRVDLDYGASPKASVFIDGALVDAQPIPQLVRPPAKAAVMRGPIPMGRYPMPTEMSFATFRLLRP